MPRPSSLPKGEMARGSKDIDVEDVSETWKDVQDVRDFDFEKDGQKITPPLEKSEKKGGRRRTNKKSKKCKKTNKSKSRKHGRR